MQKHKQTNDKKNIQLKIKFYQPDWISVNNTDA